MENEEEDVLAKHNRYLLHHIRPSVNRIIKYLYEEQVIEQEDVERILSQAGDTKKTQHLLNNLREKGKPALDYFYAATLFAKSWPAADVLHPEKRPHEVEEMEEFLPDVWPLCDYLESLSKNCLTVKDVDKANIKMKEYFDNPKKFNVYEMDQNIKGRALIINNEEFTRLPYREGSAEDQKGLEIVLKALKFDVNVAKNLTAKEMKKMLDDECKKDHSKYNCFILVILSHGDLGVVFGKNGCFDRKNKEWHDYLEIDDIRRVFSEVQSLARKPKLFIIQAHRGLRAEEIISDELWRSGHAVQDENQEENEEIELDSAEKRELKDGKKNESNTPSPHVDQSQESTPGLNPTNVEKPSTSNLTASIPDASHDNDAKEKESFEDEGDGDSSDEEDAKKYETDKYKLPLDNTESLSEGKPLHFLIALPTSEGKTSWPPLKHFDSLFIQAFIYVLANYAYKEDLNTLMMKVNELLRRAGGPHAADVSFETSLIKKLYFFPGLEKA